MATISNVLEHWATIYKPLSHDPESKKLEKQSFFRIRDIDEENIFSRNANLIHSPVMLYRIVSSGELKSDKQALITYQVCFLIKLKDSAKALGRYDDVKLQQASDDLMGFCEDLASYLCRLKRTQVCPVTNRSFKDDPQLAMQLAAFDVESFAYGVNPLFHGSQWMLADCYWTATRPLYNFNCQVNSKYNIPDPPTDNSDEDGEETSDNQGKETDQ